MKTDKELLELAAKAAGVVVFGFFDCGSVRSRVHSDVKWNPIEDDGDAFRLAAHLEISINHFDSFVKAQAFFESCAGKIVTAMIDSDRACAMRRSIVMSAAAIGEKL